MTQAIAIDDVRQLIDRRDWFGLRAELEKWNPGELADLLDALDSREQALVVRLLPRDRASNVIAQVGVHRARRLIEGLEDRDTRRLLASLRPDDRTALLEELPGPLTQHLLNLLPAEDLAEARALLGYPEESIGRVMTPDYVAVRPEWTVEEALAHIRAMARRAETVNVVYVVDRSWRLLDALELARFITARPGQRVADLMDGQYVAISAFADREEAVRLMRQSDLHALPVVDSDNTLVGIVTIDDVLDIASEEATEDFHKVGGVAPLDTRYRDASLLQLYRKRVPWLVGLVVLNLASSTVIAAYEDVLASTIALAFFIPLLIDSGGNTGAQSATLVVRALATGEFDRGGWARAFARELAVGLALGASMAAAASVLGIFRGGPEIGLVVGIAMCLIVITANLVGAVLPFLLSRLRLDPAVASSPLITTVADVAGLAIYFTTAAVILGV
ncbi:MAG: magnesium transporter [Tepidiforma sp.]